MRQSQNRLQGVFLIIAAVMIYAMSGGIRANFGILITPLSKYTGMSYADLSFVLGISQLLYGLSQPFWVALALRKSNTFVLLLGIPLMMVGILVSPFTDSLIIQSITFGVMLGAGAGALSFGMIMGAIQPHLGEQRAAIASGIINAGSGIGLALMSPLIQQLNNRAGITTTMLSLAVPFVLLIPITLWMSRLRQPEHRPSEKILPLESQESTMDIVLQAMRKPNFRALMIGFGTCVFHMIILQTHMISQFVTYGISESRAAGIYTIYGIAMILGALLSGFLCARYSVKNVLGSLYGLRSIGVAIFIFLLPKTIGTITVFAILMGLTGDATVTPTSQLVSHQFGASKMALLFGVTFVCHQIGGFISSWLGGSLRGRTRGNTRDQFKSGRLSVKTGSSLG